MRIHLHNIHSKSRSTFGVFSGRKITLFLSISPKAGVFQAKRREMWVRALVLRPVFRPDFGLIPVFWARFWPQAPPNAGFLRHEQF